MYWADVKRGKRTKRKYFVQKRKQNDPWRRSKPGDQSRRARSWLWPGWPELGFAWPFSSPLWLVSSCQWLIGQRMKMCLPWIFNHRLLSGSGPHRQFWRGCGLLNTGISYLSLHPIPAFWIGIDPFFCFILPIHMLFMMGCIRSNPPMIIIVSVKCACVLSAFASHGPFGPLAVDLCNPFKNFQISPIKQRSHCKPASPTPHLELLCVQRVGKTLPNILQSLSAKLCPLFKTLGWSQASERPWAW